MISTLLNPIIYAIFKFVSIRRDRVIPNLVLQLRELHATGLLTSADGHCADVQMSVQIPDIECHFPHGSQNRHCCFCHSVFPSSYSKLMTRKSACDIFEPQPPQRATPANAGHSEPPRCLLLYTVRSVSCKINESRYRNLPVALSKLINYYFRQRTVFGACTARAEHFIVVRTMRKVTVLTKFECFHPRVQFDSANRPRMMT